MRKILQDRFRVLEIGGGRVDAQADATRLDLPILPEGCYADAQLDDYGGLRRGAYPWEPGVTLSLEARFSHPAEQLAGTAGFGFWNAPFGDPTTPQPTLPKAVWFFFGSPPNDFPVNTNDPYGPGRGFFAGTLDATTGRALTMAPFAPATVLLNRWGRFRRSVWPGIQRRLGMSFGDLSYVNLTEWHHYRLEWTSVGCSFHIDGETVLETAQSPRGRLGFVCWIDNQFLAVTPTGSFAAGTLPLAAAQWLEIRGLNLAKNPLTLKS